MAWRLRLAPETTTIDFFSLARVTFGASVLAVLDRKSTRLNSSHVD